jgi:hypothetical protein
VDHKKEFKPHHEMNLVSTGPIERHGRHDRDKENMPPREQKPGREFEEVERYKQEAGRNFTKNHLREEVTDSDWIAKNAFDSEVIRNQKKVPEFRNADIADSLRRGAYFDEPEIKPMRSEGRGQRGNPTSFKDRDQRRPD